MEKPQERKLCPVPSFCPGVPGVGIYHITRHQLIHDNHHLSGEGDPSFCVCLFQIYYKNLHQLLDEQHNITELQRSESSRTHIDGLKVSDKDGIWQHDKMFSLI